VTLILAKIVVAATARCLLYMFADGSVSGSDLRSRSPRRFDTWPRHGCLTTLGMLFTPNPTFPEQTRTASTRPNPTRPNRLDADTLRYSMESLNCVPLRCLVLNRNDESVSGASNYYYYYCCCCCCCCYYYYYYARSTASFSGQPGQAGTRKVEPVWI